MQLMDLGQKQAILVAISVRTMSGWQQSFFRALMAGSVASARSRSSFTPASAAAFTAGVQGQQGMGVARLHACSPVASLPSRVVAKQNRCNRK